MIRSTICLFVPFVIFWLHSRNETETCKLQCNDFHSPPFPHHMSSFSKQIWVVPPLSPSKVFSDPPLQGNTCHTITLYVREKHFMITRGLGKKILTQTNEITQITCRKSCYCLILRWRHQNLMVHSRSKLVHVYSLLHDECNTAGRLARYFLRQSHSCNHSTMKYSTFSPLLQVEKRGWIWRQEVFGHQE